MSAELNFAFSDYCRSVLVDLTRQWVLLVWGALLLAIYLSGWWREDFARVVLAVLITLFATAPHARGLMVLAGLLFLLGCHFNQHLGAELNEFLVDAKSLAGIR